MPAFQPPAPVTSPAPDKSSEEAQEEKHAKSKSSKRHPAEATSHKKVESGYYATFGRATDEVNEATNEKMSRHKDDGYYAPIKPALGQPIEESVPPPPVVAPPVEQTPRKIIPPVQRTVDPDARKFDDDPGKAGSITFTRHETQAKQFMSDGHYDLAKRHFIEALRIKPEAAELYPGLWESCMKTADWSGALHALDKLFEIDPSKQKAYAWAHGIAQYKLTRYDQAISELHKAQANGTHLEEIHMALLRIAQQRRNTDDIAAEYNAIAKMKPRDYNTQLEYANLLEQTGKHSEAIAHYKAAVAISQTDGATLARLAYMLMYYNKDYAGAIGYYNKAIQADPARAQSYQQNIQYAEKQQHKKSADD